MVLDRWYLSSERDRTRHEMKIGTIKIYLLTVVANGIIKIK